jgi:YD repeat-containing protein
VLLTARTQYQLIRQVTVKGGATYTFGYNPDGLRTSKTVNGVNTSFLLDGASVVSETTGGAASTRCRARYWTSHWLGTGSGSCPTR